MPKSSTARCTPSATRDLRISFFAFPERFFYKPVSAPVCSRVFPASLRILTAMPAGALVGVFTREGRTDFMCVPEGSLREACGIAAGCLRIGFARSRAAPPDET